MTGADWSAVEAIYAAGITAGHATFETTTPSWEQFDASKLEAHRLVADEHGQILGWVAVSPVSVRPAYAGVVEFILVRGRGAGYRGCNRFANRFDQVRAKAACA